MNDELTRALRALPVRDLDPLRARAIAVAAEARLRARASSSPLERLEPPLLVTLAGVHLVWLVLRVFT